MPDDSKVPKNAVRAIVVILATMIALALYTHVQKWRRDKLETVTVTLLPTAYPSPSTP